MVNPTYKHLEAKLRLGAFSLVQWAQVLAAALAAIMFGVYASPFSPGPTVFLSVLVAGLPLALSYGAMGLEFSVGELARVAMRFYRSPRRYLAGPGAVCTGYVVEHEPAVSGRGVAAPVGQLHSEAMWDG